MKCPNCGGQEIPPNGRFCPDCGLEIIRRPVPAQASQAPRETTVHVARASDTAGHDVLPPRRAPPGYGPVPSTHAPPRSRAPRIVLSFILTVMVIGAGFAVLTVMTWGSFQGQAEYATPVTTTNSSSWDIHVDTARLSVGYSSTIDAPVAEFIVSYSWAGAFMAGKTSSDLYTVNFSESGTFILERTDWFPFAMFDNTSVIVTLRQGIEYTLNLSASVGSIRLDVPDGQVLGPLNVHTSTGSTSISLGLDTNVLGDVTIATSTGSTAFSIKDGSKVNGLLDVSSSTGSCSLVAGGANITGGIVASMSTGSLEAVLAGTILGGNVSWSSSTGSVDATMENVVLSRDIHLDVDVSTGSVLLNITQDVNPTANLTGRVVSSTGSVDISFSGASLFVNARFSASSSLGSTDFTNLGGFEKAGQLFLSTGTSAASTFSIDAVVSTGSVEITGLMV